MCPQGKCAGDVATVIVDMFYAYGPPRRVITDRGGEFVNEVRSLTIYSSTVYGNNILHIHVISTYNFYYYNYLISTKCLSWQKLQAMLSATISACHFQWVCERMIMFIFTMNGNVLYPLAEWRHSEGIWCEPLHHFALSPSLQRARRADEQVHFCRDVQIHQRVRHILSLLMKCYWFVSALIRHFNFFHWCSTLLEVILLKKYR